jgi:pyruvate/2-oxoglutarate/acetoin dehydrogenase E1 component
MREITYLEAVREALVGEMRRDPEVMLLGEDVGVYGGAFGVSKGMIEEFGPERVRDTPISEAGIAGAAIGAAMMGMRPVMEIMFMDFVTIAMDQLVNQAAKIHFMFGGKASVPMVLRTPAGSGTGAAEQHSQSLEAWLVHVPGLKVVMPSTPYDAKGLLVSAIRDNNPVMFIEHKLLYHQKGTVPEGEYTIPLRKGDLKRVGKDCTIIAWSKRVLTALQAAEELAKEGVEVEVVDPRTIKPLDEEILLRSVAKTHRCVIVEEGWPFAGVGAEISHRIQRGVFDELDAPIERVCAADVPMPYALNLEELVVPTVPKIIRAVKRAMYLES